MVKGCEGTGCELREIYLSINAIHESIGTARDIDDAESKAVQQVTDHLSALASTSFWNSYHKVLLNVLGREFFGPKLSAVDGPVRIEEVSRKEGSWVLTIKGQWTDKVTLNDKYEIIDVSRTE